MNNLGVRFPYDYMNKAWALCCWTLKGYLLFKYGKSMIYDPCELVKSSFGLLSTPGMYLFSEKWSTLSFVNEAFHFMICGGFIAFLVLVCGMIFCCAKPNYFAIFLLLMPTGLLAYLVFFFFTIANSHFAYKL